MKSRSDIWLRALEELGAQCSVSTTRDANTFARRCAQEGEQFITVTLPAFGKELEKALAIGSIPTGAFPGWGRQKLEIEFFDRSAMMVLDSKKISGGIPKFLGGFLDLVFDSVVRVTNSEEETPLQESRLVPRLKTYTSYGEMEAMASAIAAVRQLTLMFAKEKALCTPARNEAAISQFVQTDEELDLPLKDDRAAILFQGGRLDRTRQVIRLVFGNALSKVDGEIYHQELVPGHGPGATADRLRGNQKWHLPTWTDRLEQLFPYGEYAVPNLRYAWRYDQVQFLKPEDEIPAKQVLVPKTQTTPRLISIEPTCMQYIQQAISKSLVHHLESDEDSKWFVGFTEQWPNQALAQIGSEDGSLATLDLSEASDRVANWLVEDLFADFPWFLEGIQACRSERVKLASGEVIPLLKYASMGSALTFPIEAMVFCAIVLERVLFAADLPATRSSIRKFRDMVRVYGDDIIVPTDYAETVIGGLETLGFKVNKNKSFWTGSFRESCGKEYWNGLDVSIVRFRTVLPTSLRDVQEIVSTVSTRNLLFRAGMWKTAALLDSVLEKILKGFYPYVAESSPVLGKWTFGNRYDITDYHPHTHAPLVKGFVVKSPVPINKIDDEIALMKCLIETIGQPNADDEHLTRSGRPRAVSIKLVKASPF